MSGAVGVIQPTVRACGGSGGHPTSVGCVSGRVMSRMGWCGGCLFVLCVGATVAGGGGRLLTVAQPQATQVRQARFTGGQCG